MDHANFAFKPVIKKKTAAKAMVFEDSEEDEKPKAQPLQY
jgi:hypothetical protein